MPLQDGNVTPETNYSVSYLPNEEDPQIVVSEVGVGFYGTDPTAQPTVTGAHADNAALVSLLVALDSLGLIVDGSE